MLIKYFTEILLKATVCHIRAKITINGTISGGIPSGQYMWAFVNSQQNPNEWWPQGLHIQPQNGQWSTPVTVGGEIASYIGIFVYLVNETDDTYLRDYGDKGDKTENRPGISLPKSARKVANIIVIRE